MQHMQPTKIYNATMKPTKNTIITNMLLALGVAFFYFKSMLIIVNFQFSCLVDMVNEI